MSNGYRYNRYLISTKFLLDWRTISGKYLSEMRWSLPLSCYADHVKLFSWSLNCPLCETPSGHTISEPAFICYQTPYHCWHWLRWSSNFGLKLLLVLRFQTSVALRWVESGKIQTFSAPKHLDTTLLSSIIVGQTVVSIMSGSQDWLRWHSIPE